MLLITIYTTIRIANARHFSQVSMPMRDLRMYEARYNIMPNGIETHAWGVRRSLFGTAGARDAYLDIL